MICALQFLDSVVEGTWQQFRSEFQTRYDANAIVKWGEFYVFAGRQSLSREQARLLARLWEGDKRVVYGKHGINFTIRAAPEASETAAGPLSTGDAK